MNAQSRRIVVVSIDSWLSKLYGGSILDLFSSLLSFGHSVEVLLMSSPSSRVNEKNLSIVTIGLRYSVPMLRYFYFLIRITGYLIRKKPQILIFDRSILPCF